MKDKIDYVGKPCLIRHGEYAVPVIPYKKIEEGENGKKLELQGIIYFEEDSPKAIPLIFPRSLMIVDLDQDTTKLGEQFYNPLRESLEILAINNPREFILE